MIGLMCVYQLHVQTLTLPIGNLSFHVQSIQHLPLEGFPALHRQPRFAKVPQSTGRNHKPRAPTAVVSFSHMVSLLEIGAAQLGGSVALAASGPCLARWAPREELLFLFIPRLSHCPLKHSLCQVGWDQTCTKAFARPSVGLGLEFRPSFSSGNHVSGTSLSALPLSLGQISVVHSELSGSKALGHAGTFTGVNHSPSRLGGGYFLPPPCCPEETLKHEVPCPRPHPKRQGQGTKGGHPKAWALFY